MGSLIPYSYISLKLKQTVTAIIAKKTPPENKDKELTPILDELSHDPDIKLDQMKSLIIVCVAFHEFSEDIVKGSIKSLRPYKRQQLLAESVSCHSTSALFFFGQPYICAIIFYRFLASLLGLIKNILETTRFSRIVICYGIFI